MLREGRKVASVFTQKSVVAAPGNSARLLTRGRYEDIPLEQCAYRLEARFETASQPFSVEAEVAQWIEQGLF